MLFLEALTFSRRPDKPTIVVEGVNSTNADLVWEILPDSGEVVQNLFLIRQRPGDVNQVQIAWRKYSSSFTLAEGFANEYRANLPATLRLLNVDNTEEYVYTLQVSYDLNNVPHRTDDSVTVIVRGKSNNFALYPRRASKWQGILQFILQILIAIPFYCVPERNSRHYEVKTKVVYRCLFYEIDRVGKQYFVLLIDFKASCEASAILEESRKIVIFMLALLC